VGVEGSKPSWTLTFSFSRKKQKTMEEDIEVEGEWRKVKVYGKYTPQRPGKQPSYEQFVLEAEHFADLIFGNLDELMLKPRAERADYADIVCKHMAHNEKWVLAQLEESSHESDFSTWNSCSIANVCYLWCNSQSERVKERSEKLLNNYEKWYKEKK